MLPVKIQEKWYAKRNTNVNKCGMLRVRCKLLNIFWRWREWTVQNRWLIVMYNSFLISSQRKYLISKDKTSFTPYGLRLWLNFELVEIEDKFLLYFFNPAKMKWAWTCDENEDNIFSSVDYGTFHSVRCSVRFRHKMVGFIWSYCFIRFIAILLISIDEIKLLWPEIQPSDKWCKTILTSREKDVYVSVML